MDTLLQDVRYAVRMLLRTPGFTLAAVLTLALGIGANTAIFSVVNAVLLKPLPFREPAGLVRIFGSNREMNVDRGAFSVQDLEDVTAGARSLASVGSWFYAEGQSGMNLLGSGEPTRVDAAFVSGTFFPTLGAAAQAGRVMGTADDVAGSDRVVVLSDALWRQRFGGDPAVVGRTLRLDGEQYTVVGVMPRSFGYPARTVQLWVPLSRVGEDMIPHIREVRWLSAVARLRPGATPQVAGAEVAAVMRRLSQQYPASNRQWTGGGAVGVTESVVGDVARPLWLLLGVVALVLLIACANLVNLLLARSTARKREISIRSALGAARGRVVRQLLTESLVLALAGGAVGLAVATYGVRALVAMSAGAIPRPDDAGVDGRVVLFALAISVVVGLLFGAHPALAASRGELAQTLREGGRGGTGRGGRTRAALVAAETAMAALLLAGSALMLKSFWRLTHVEPGFHTEHVLAVSLTIPFDRYNSPAKIDAYRSELMRKVREVPGVITAGASKTLPLQGGGEPYTFQIAGRDGEQGRLQPSAGVFGVTPGYFATLRVPVLRGRDFTEDDGRAAGTPVVAINSAAARRYWPGQDPVGGTLVLNNTPLRVIAVVGDVRTEGLASPAGAAVYMPMSLFPRVNTQIVVRTAGDPAAVAAGVRQAIHEVNPEQPISDMAPLAQVVSDTVARPRFFTVLLGLFGALSLVLAAIGLYGVVSYAVGLRTAEIAVRMALGAKARDVVGMVLNGAMRPVGVGVVVGLAAALMLTRLMRGMLYDVQPGDPSTLLAVAAFLCGVAALAAWLPARRAAAVDPMGALRQE